jgi:hypothetical protein
LNSNPIGAITEIRVKGFTLGMKAEIENKFLYLLHYYGPDLALKQKKDTYQL